MRVGVVLVAYAIYKRYIPWVYAEHVVQLVDAELTHFIRFPVWGTQDRKNGSLPFYICNYIGVG